MSTVSKPPAPSPTPTPPEPDDDPYRYGWRFVRVKNPDGSFREEQVPLAENDLLFPRTGDFIVQSQGHIQDVAYLFSVFGSQVAGDPSAAVISDCRVNFNLPKVKALGPDVSLFLGVKRQQDWATFNVAAEGAKPALVVEITSESTRKNDLGIKVEYYHRAKVPFYLVVDATRPKGIRHLTLIGHRYTPQGYERIEPDARGKIYLDSVDLYVGVTHDRLAGYDRLACFDPKTGEELGDYTALREAIDKARKETQRVKREIRAETRARIEAEARIRTLEAEAWAQSEALARVQAEAEAQIRELKAELGRSRHRSS
jgi:colicin import membrane protein